VHQIRIDPSNKWVFVPVRGDDAKEKTEGKKAEPEKFGHLNIFEFNDGSLSKHKVIDYPTLLGPRHLDFHPSKPWVYVAFERGNRIVTYKHEDGTLTELFNSTTLGDPSFKFSAQRVGPIHVHPNGKWVYLANRSVSPNQPVGTADKPFASGENDVAVFSIDAATGEPKLVQNIETHGFEARTLTIDPTGHFLLVANQKEVPKKDGDKIVKVEPNLSIFRIGDDGKLTAPYEAQLMGVQALFFIGAAFLATVFCAMMLPASYTAWMAANWLLFALQSWDISAPRFVLAMFPMFILIAKLARHRHWNTAITVWSLLWLGILASQFVVGHWTF